MGEQLFEQVRFDEARLLKYSGASHTEDRSLKADLFLSFAILGRYESGYAQIVPRFRPSWPTPQEFADETFADIVGVCWQRKIPPDIRNLLATTKTAVFSAHGNIYRDSDENGSDVAEWYAHLEGELVIPIPTLVSKHLSAYETIILGVCNPARREPFPTQGTVIYPAYLFGWSDETTMIPKTAQPKAQ